MDSREIRSVTSDIPYARPYFPEGTSRVLNEAFESTFISGTGSAIIDFENKISELIDVRHTIAVNNGTAALRLVYQNIGVNRETDVILPGWGFHAAANVAYNFGANLKFVDIDPKSWCIDGKFIDEISDTKRKTIVVLIHTLGNSIDLELIEPLAQNPNISLVEDAAEALMSRYRGRYLGTIFDFGTFSMHAAKTITTGEGGFVVTNNQERARRLKSERSQGMVPTRPYLHEFSGENFRLSNLLAAIALPQLEEIEWIVEQRKTIYESYKEKLPESHFEFLAPTDHKGFVPWGVCVRIIDSNEEQINQLQDYLCSRGIETRLGFTSASQLPYFKQEMLIAGNSLKNAITLASQTILLPHYIGLRDDQVSQICQAIIWFVKQKRTTMN